MSEETGLNQQISETISYIRKHTSSSPEAGIILGTGLGGLTANIETEVVIPYSDLPHFPFSTVETHTGRLIFGTVYGRKVVAMEGRFHFYEGYSMRQIVYPVRVMKSLGARSLLVSNASGSLNPLFHKGGVMLINDHINFLGTNPLIGKNENDFGPRFPDMSRPYSQRLANLIKDVALESKIILYEGVYAAMPGPMLETRAEYRFLRLIGADAVGMSTVPEVIAARHAGMEVLGISILTDECYPDALKSVTIDEIIEVASRAEPSLTFLLKELIKKM